jgi:CrcB protein
LSQLTFPVVLGVAGMGAAGALSRWAVGMLVSRAVPGAFPWGTLAANALGCLLLGVVTGLSAELLPAHLRVPIATGFLGSFTTFSTFSVESVKLAEQGAWGLLAANVLGSVVVGLLGAGAGLYLGRALG